MKILNAICKLVDKKQAERDKLPDFLEATTESQESQIIGIGRDIRRLQKAGRTIMMFEHELTEEMENQ